MSDLVTHHDQIHRVELHEAGSKAKFSIPCCCVGRVHEKACDGDCNTVICDCSAGGCCIEVTETYDEVLAKLCQAPPAP